MMKKVIGVLGAGNMGFAIIQGLIQKGWQDQILFLDQSKKRCQWVFEKTGLHSEKDIKTWVQKADILVFAIKPQQYKEALQKIQSYISQNQILVSIAPGISTTTIQDWMGIFIRVVRAMPNTPALIGEGMTALCFSKGEYTEEEKYTIDTLFHSLGQVEYLNETVMDAVVPISGSSPAYVYMMIEAMADAGVLQGLPREKAYRLAAQAVLGSAKMVLETKKHPGVLKDQVCSPSGTTIEAVRILEKKGFRSALIEAMEECYKKTKGFK